MSVQPTPNCFDSNHPIQGALSRSFLALKTEANAKGPWLDTRILRNMSAHIFGTFGSGTVTIYGTNEEVGPMSSGAPTGGIALAAGQTAAVMLALNTPCRWVRAELTGATDPDITVALHGVA